MIGEPARPEHVSPRRLSERSVQAPIDNSHHGIRPVPHFTLVKILEGVDNIPELGVEPGDHSVLSQYRCPDQLRRREHANNIGPRLT